MAITAIRVARDYDGIHRLMLAVSEWTKTIAPMRGIKKKVLVGVCLVMESVLVALNVIKKNPAVILAKPKKKKTKNLNPPPKRDVRSLIKKFQWY